MVVGDRVIIDGQEVVLTDYPANNAQNNLPPPLTTPASGPAPNLPAYNSPLFSNSTSTSTSSSSESISAPSSGATFSIGSEPPPVSSPVATYSFSTSSTPPKQSTLSSTPPSTTFPPDHHISTITPPTTTTTTTITSEEGVDRAHTNTVYLHDDEEPDNNEMLETPNTATTATTTVTIATTENATQPGSPLMESIQF